jgi:glycosyltransferase
MKQLPDFDLSIVMPFYKRLDEFKRVFPSKAKYYERNGIEVVIVADEPGARDLGLYPKVSLYQLESRGQRRGSSLAKSGESIQCRHPTGYEVVYSGDGSGVGVLYGCDLRTA